MLNNETKYRNAHISESDESFIDCEFKDELTGEWMPTSIPLDLNDPLNCELGKKILKEVSKSDLKKVIRDGKLVEKPNSEVIAEAKQRITDARNTRLKQLDSKAQELITGGFVSEVAGSARLYGSKVTDQNNLLTALLSGSDAYVACKKIDGNDWVRTQHSTEKLKILLRDFEMFKFDILSTLDKHKSKVGKAKTVKAIEKVVWK